MSPKSGPWIIVFSAGISGVYTAGGGEPHALNCIRSHASHLSRFSHLITLLENEDMIGP